MNMSPSINQPPPSNHHLHPSLNSEPPPHHDSRLYSQPPQSIQVDPSQEDQKPHSLSYEPNGYIHLPPPSSLHHHNSDHTRNHNCFAPNNNGSKHPDEHKLNLQPKPQRNTISPSLSHRSSPTPSATSSPSSPPFYNHHAHPATIIDLNSIVSYSQLIQRREEVVNALKYRSGDHYAQQALDLLKAGRERVKRITAAGRVATGKPPVKHIQEQYLAVFSRYSEYCTSQNIPTWPIEPVRVAIWVLAMQEKSPPTPATLRQYITRLEFTCTVTSNLFENEFGPSSPLKGSALLRELVNRDLPGQSPSHKASPNASRASKPSKRARSHNSNLDNEGSITPPSAKKWQSESSATELISTHHHHHPNQTTSAPPTSRHEYYDAYLSPFGTPASNYHHSPIDPHHQQHHPPQEIWSSSSSQPPPPGQRYPDSQSHHLHYHPHLHHHHQQPTHPRELIPHDQQHQQPQQRASYPYVSSAPTTTNPAAFTSSTNANSTTSAAATATTSTAPPASHSDSRYPTATAAEANPWV